MIRTTVEALGGAQAVPSDLIPARELHQHLINQVATGAGKVVLADTARQARGRGHVDSALRAASRRAEHPAPQQL